MCTKYGSEAGGGTFILGYGMTHVVTIIEPCEDGLTALLAVQVSESTLDIPL